MILLLLSLLAGVLTVLAPCTISLLPVIVGGSVAEGHNVRRAFVVTISLGLSVVLFTLILKVSTAFITIPQMFWQIFSGVIIFLLGLTMLYPSLYDRLPWVNKMNQESNKLLATGYNKKNFWGDVIMGAALGPVFSSCSPTYFLILATVLPRSLGTGIVYLFAYALGLCVSLLIVTLAGQKLIAMAGVASNPKSWLKRVVGVLFLVIGVAIAFGLDKTFETYITNAGFFDVTKVEQNLLSKELVQNPVIPAPSTDSNTTAPADTKNTTKEDQARITIKSLKYARAPEITSPSGFINTDGQPITISQFKGKKVVLVDFWTYSCINCQRTLPYIKAWYDKYNSEGLEIISIHTPEFGFEKVQSNVQKAVDGFGIKYPVVMDNDFGTWTAFANQFWPHKYLIDTDGFIVYDHAGEGDYDVTEAAIQKALAERASILGDDMQVTKGTVAPSGVVNVDDHGLGSPETYFGSARNEYLANGDSRKAGTQTMTIPVYVALNNLYLGGTWNFNPEYAETADAGESITYQYKAKNVYFVASSASGTDIQISIDGKLARTLTIKDNKLYQLVAGSDYAAHTLTIKVLGPGLDAYTFTFG